MDAASRTKFGVEATYMWDGPKDGPVRVAIDVFRFAGPEGWTGAEASGVYVRSPDGTVTEG